MYDITYQALFYFNKYKEIYKNTDNFINRK